MAQQKHDLDELKRLIAVIDAEIGEVDDVVGMFDYARALDWRAKRKDAEKKMMAHLESEGASFSSRPAVDYAVRLAGIRSTSTSGVIGALRNWIRAARNRIEKGGV